MIKQIKIGLLVAALFYTNGNLSAQLGTKLLQVDSIKGRYDYFEVDELGNIYGLQQKEGRNILLKIKSKNQNEYQYSNETLGDLASVDVSNPFFLLLFFKDFQQLQFLDRTLSVIGNLDLGELDLWDVNAACLSNSGDIWLWDEGDFKLKKIDKNGQLMIESRDLRLIANPNIHLIRLQTYENKLYGLDAEIGIYEFDISGQLEYFVPLSKVDDFFVYQHKVFYLQNGGVNFYGLNNHLSNVVLPSIDRIQQIRANANGIFLLQKNRIVLYQEKE